MRHGAVGVTAGLILGFGVLAAQPVGALELFGIRLWGEAEQDAPQPLADPLPYSVRIETGSREMRDLVENASTLWAERDVPAAGKAGLIARGRGDYRRILAALFNAGHYGPEISITLGGRELADLSLSSDIAPGSALRIRVDPGPQFRFGTLEIVNPPPRVLHDDEAVIRTPEDEGFRTGAPALAEAIETASRLSVREWRKLSHAKANEADLEVIADHRYNTLNVRIVIEPGPAVRYGPIAVRGTKRMDPEFTAYMANLDIGHRYDPDEVSDAQARLAKLGVFSALRIEESDDIGPDGRMPFTIYVSERKRRGIGFGGTYSTLDGLGLSAFWLHRNMFGRAERLRFDASIERLLESDDWDDYDYTIGPTFTRPGALNPDTDFIASLNAKQADIDNYRERSVTARAGFSQTFTDRLNAELFLEAARARYEDDFGTRHFSTFGLNGTVQFDRRDNKLDPTRGYLLAARLTPFYEAEYGNAAARATLEGRVYRGLGAESRFVLAARARVGTYVGASRAESPPGLLFFAGGGGSVRGYEFRSIGVERTDELDETSVSGGHSLAEISAEARLRFGENYGAVAFVDGGTVGGKSALGDLEDVRYGAGLGLRYYTAFGPLRLDVAVPLDKREGDDDFGLYIGIGQAF